MKEYTSESDSMYEVNWQHARSYNRTKNTYRLNCVHDNSRSVATIRRVQTVRPDGRLIENNRNEWITSAHVTVEPRLSGTSLNRNVCSSQFLPTDVFQLFPES